jgi:hypothetical protein
MFHRLFGFGRQRRHPQGCSAPSKPHRRGRWQPRLEQLESRYVPSTAWVNAAGVLQVAPNPAGDYVALNQRGGFTEVGGGMFKAGTFNSIYFLSVPGDVTINIRNTPAGTPVTVDLGNGTDTVNIENTLPNAPVTVNALSWPEKDTINISPIKQFLDNIQGNVTVNGSGAVDGSLVLNVYDLKDPFAGDTYTITGSTVTRNASAVITYNGPLQSVSLFGGTGSAFGGEIYNVASTQNAPVTIMGGQNHDTFNICPISGPGSDNLGFIQAPVTVNGSGGNDALNIFDGGDPNSATYTITDTTVAWTFSNLITYLNVGSMVLNGNNNGNTYNVESTGANTPVTINGGNGNDTFEISPTDMHLDNIGSLLTIHGGTGANKIEMWDTFVDTYTVTNTATTVASLSPNPLLTYSGVNTLKLHTMLGSTVFNMTTAPVTLTWP